MLLLTNITAGYGMKQVLHNLSLEVSAGEITALIGPNGAGKSTVLKIVAGVLKPIAGSIMLDGRDITLLQTFQRFHLSIGYVMQNAPVFNSLTVAEHIRLIKGSKEQCNRHSALWKTAGVLSGGERHRLAVELVLQRQSKLLLLDEPSAGVSPGIAVEIYQRIKEQIRGTDTAVLVVEQNLQFLPDFATRIVVMRNGEIFKNNLPLDQLKNTETIFKTFYGE